MESRKKIIVGTRGSELALWQAEATENLLRAAFPDVEVVRQVIKTTGDRRTDVALSQVAKSEGILDKGVFTKELEIALEAGEIDVAVHSLKDVPTILSDLFVIPATLERAGVRDAMVCRTEGGLAALPEGAKVGTSSVRRARQLQWLRPDLVLCDLRGNVPTRLNKLAQGEDYDAIMLAEAGLLRLGYLERNDLGLHYAILPEDEFFPAAGQGAIGLEIRSDDDWMNECLKKINHQQTFVRVTAEREFLRLLDAGCHTPVGVYSALDEDELSMYARVFPEEGGEPKVAQVSGSAAEPLAVARELFETLS